MRSNDLIRVASESVIQDFFEARVPSLSVPIRLEYSAIRDLRAGFDGDGEKLGLLLGSSSPEALSIQCCELLALSPATLADPKSLQGALHQFIRARLRSPLEDAPELMGCFRTQSTGWPGMKDADLEIAKRSFPGLDPLFMLIRTTQHRPWQAALYALDGKAAKAPTQPSLEFPFDEYLLRNGLTDLREADEPAELVVQSKLVAPSKKNLFIAAGIAAFLLTGSAAAYKWYRPGGKTDSAGRSVSASAPLKLKVSRSGKDFEVSWDRLSAAVQQASEGMLTINDGTLTRAVSLSGPQLREGQILYTPLFEELTFRLEVGMPDQGGAAESVQVLAWSGKKPSEVLTVPPLPPSDPPAAANTLARVFSAASANPPDTKQDAKQQTKQQTKLPAVLPAVVPTPKATAAVKSAPPAAPVNAAVNNTKQPAKSASTPETVAVIQPPPPTVVRNPDPAPPASARAPETSPRPAVSDRPPAAQPTTPPTQQPTQQPPVTPAPKPEPPPVSQSIPAAPVASAAAPTPVPAIATGVSPAPVATTPAAASAVIPPVPIQRVAPNLPRGIPARTTVGGARVISVRIMVDTAGRVQSSEVVASTPKGGFGESQLKAAALDAAKLWKFRPGQVNGKNVTAEYTIEFKFQ